MRIIKFVLCSPWASAQGDDSPCGRDGKSAKSGHLRRKLWTCRSVAEALCEGALPWTARPRQQKGRQHHGEKLVLVTLSLNQGHIACRRSNRSPTHAQKAGNPDTHLCQSAPPVLDKRCGRWVKNEYLRRLLSLWVHAEGGHISIAT